MPATFVREGSVVTSVNYRLAPAVKYDAQAQGAEEGGKARSGADEEVAYRDACERRKRRGDPIILVQL